MFTFCGLRGSNAETDNDTSIVDQHYAVNYYTWILSRRAVPHLTTPEIIIPPGNTIVTSLKDEDKGQPALFYPNPTGNNLYWKTFDQNREGIETVTIINSQGQQTKWTLNPSTDITGISVEALPPGWYFINLESANTSYRGKFIKH